MGKETQIETKSRKSAECRVDESFFDGWSSEMAYILGFFCADGYMFKNPRGSCFIAFCITDKPLLEKIAGF